jgi:hypothetical protein
VQDNQLLDLEEGEHQTEEERTWRRGHVSNKETSIRGLGVRGRGSDIREESTPGKANKTQD